MFSCVTDQPKISRLASLGLILFVVQGFEIAHSQEASDLGDQVLQNSLDKLNQTGIDSMFEGKFEVATDAFKSLATQSTKLHGATHWRTRWYERQHADNEWMVTQVHVPRNELLQSLRCIQLAQLLQNVDDLAVLNNCNRAEKAFKSFDHTFCLEAVNRAILANAYLRLDTPDWAEKYSQLGLETVDEIDGRGSHIHIRLLVSLSTAQMRQGKWKESIKAWREAYKVLNEDSEPSPELVQLICGQVSDLLANCRLSADELEWRGLEVSIGDSTRVTESMFRIVNLKLDLEQAKEAKEDLITTVSLIHQMRLTAVASFKRRDRHFLSVEHGIARLKLSENEKAKPLIDEAYDSLYDERASQPIFGWHRVLYAKALERFSAGDFEAARGYIVRMSKQLPPPFSDTHPEWELRHELAAKIEDKLGRSDIAKLEREKAIACRSSAEAAKVAITPHLEEIRQNIKKLKTRYGSKSQSKGN